MGMIAPQATLLPNMAKKNDKEDYTTYVARHIFATDVVQSSLSFFFAMFGSRVTQGVFIPILFPYFLQVLPYMTNFYRNFFTPNSSPLAYICSIHCTLNLVGKYDEETDVLDCRLKVIAFSTCAKDALLVVKCMVVWCVLQSQRHEFCSLVYMYLCTKQ